MSEFSDSLHLLDVDEDEAMRRLLAAGVTGLLLPGPASGAARGPVAVLIPPEQQQRFLDRAPGLIISYAFAADHGLAVHLYQRGRVLARIESDFEGGRPPVFDRQAWIAQGLLDERSAASIERWLARGRPERQKRHRVAERLGLHEVDMISGRDVLERMDALQERFPEARLVLGDQQPSVPHQDREVVLCALSVARRRLVQADPELIEELLQARHTEEIRGLLDLGRGGGDLVRQLSQPLPEIVEAVTGSTGAPLTRSARLLEPSEVARLALVLMASGVLLAREAETFEALVRHYAEAAERGDAMLVIAS